MTEEWVYCPNGSGNQHEDGKPSRRLRHFKQGAVGLVMSQSKKTTTVLFIGSDEMWEVKSEEVKRVDVFKTGDTHCRKICNICHCLLPIAKVATLD